MDAAAKLQDMPPPGGYKKIPFARVPPKSYFTGKTVKFLEANKCFEIKLSCCFLLRLAGVGCLCHRHHGGFVHLLFECKNDQT